jgi:hypothetical protein
MRILAPCMQCQIELGHPSFKPIVVDYYDDGLAIVECSAGHKTALMVQSSKFEMLLESGATALLEGFTFEACAGFSSALERFYEFAIRVICHARGMLDENGNPSKTFATTFASMSRQSERQLGAFMLLHAMEFDEPYAPPSKLVEFRNNVIHKGEIPTLEDAQKFCAEVYTIISSMFVKVNAKYPENIRSVIMQSLLERHKKVPADMRTSTIGHDHFFSTSTAATETDFKRALDKLIIVKRMTASAISKM